VVNVYLTPWYKCSVVSFPLLLKSHSRSKDPKWLRHPIFLTSASAAAVVHRIVTCSSYFMKSVDTFRVSDFEAVQLGGRGLRQHTPHTKREGRKRRLFLLRCCACDDVCCIFERNWDSSSSNSPLLYYLLASIIELSFAFAREMSLKVSVANWMNKTHLISNYLA
jgi:hypothetical protein